MSEIVNMRLTKQGELLKNKMELGDGMLALNITRIVTGAGKSDNPLEQTEVLDPKQEFETPNRFIDDGRTTIQTILTNFSVQQGYEMHQIGFYADDPDEGEILYRISQFPKPVYVPPARMSAWTYTPEFCFSTHNAFDVQININPAGLALKSEVAAAISAAQQALTTAGDALATAEESAEIVNEVSESTQANEQISQELQETQETANEARDLAQTALDAIAEIINAGTNIATYPFSIPTTDWKPGTNGRYRYYADIVNEEITASSSGSMTLEIPSQDIANEAGFCPTGQTLNGRLRVWSEAVPTAAIVGEYNVIGAGGTGGGMSGYTFATNEDTEAMLKEVFGD